MRHDCDIIYVPKGEGQKVIRHLRMHYKRRRRRIESKLRKLDIISEAIESGAFETMPEHQKKTLSDWSVDLGLGPILKENKVLTNEVPY